MKNDTLCIFPGRKLQRIEHELENVRQELEHGRKELENAQQQLTIVHQRSIEAQRDLTTSQLDLLALKEQGLVHERALEITFRLLQSPSQRAGAILRLAALQSKSKEQFCGTIGNLPSYFVAELSEDVNHAPGLYRATCSLEEYEAKMPVQQSPDHYGALSLVKG